MKSNTTMVALCAFWTLFLYANIASSETSALPVSVPIDNFVAKQTAVVIAVQNLNQMAGALGQQEREAVQGVLSDAYQILPRASALVNLRDILFKMTSSADQVTVRSYFIESTKYFVRAVDTSLEMLNLRLLGIRTPSALAEATKVRDNLIEAREIAAQLGSMTAN
jgi:hypothetical protein